MAGSVGHLSWTGLDHCWASRWDSPLTPYQNRRRHQGTLLISSYPLDIHDSGHNEHVSTSWEWVFQDKTMNSYFPPHGTALSQMFS